MGAIINNHNYCLGPTSETTFFLRHPQPGPPEACRIFFLSVLTRAFLRRCLCSDACLLPALDHGVAVPLTGVGLDSAIYWPPDVTSPRHSCGVMSARGGGPRELTVGADPPQGPTAGVLVFPAVPGCGPRSRSWTNRGRICTAHERVPTFSVPEKREGGPAQHRHPVMLSTGEPKAVADLALIKSPCGPRFTR